MSLEHCTLRTIGGAAVAPRSMSRGRKHCGLRDLRAGTFSGPLTALFARSRLDLYQCAKERPGAHS